MSQIDYLWFQAWFRRLDARLDVIEAQQSVLLKRVSHMSEAVDALVQTVSELSTVVDSENALLDQVFALLQAAIDSGDMAKVQQAKNDLEAKKAEMVAAIVRNTPAAPPATP